MDESKVKYFLSYFKARNPKYQYLGFRASKYVVIGSLLYIWIN